MPKHAFKFPPEVIAAVKQHVRNAIENVEPARYRQEANYTAALLNRLRGVAYRGEHGSVVFESTVFDDRGRTAESIYGADHAITGTISDGRTTIRKAILVQAKLGRVSELSRGERNFLESQITKMKQLVDAPKVMEIPEAQGRRYPAMISGNNILSGNRYSPMALEDYFTARVTTTLDGCTDVTTIARVQDSSIPILNVTAKIERRD